ncbi:hypothetical protein IEQ34_023349 [Dendrobium chrysotoxum]|uniref:Large ribosomal subunit protein uL2 C-terminal domain-containing protein n=1 Tax=Dendrobium chrysotoxum TaxID=161865 RepID=A0AAV7FRF5_DENCH|nr:hypothetical protein IEQ34_025947 [Dendrobium chrysotoxum]KAH0440347.1 hypothetical protein IEQ34_025589 [Dendrobium chrysotoxum]KAH0445552.1 hypothetical protein IEQ34_025396 [Dendrobium chrysotoxum]KAH0445576.1 hypothetical protein IEQ34_025342 [Dendrobium chrysotoxum]KAH0445848.1 hypothetical protein IEQ34_025302 [Dendrobium chrysotoxum]
MPLGTAIHNIEITLGKEQQALELIAKEGKSATLPSGEVRLISKNCLATVGQVGNVGVNQKSLGRAGSQCWLGKRPVVRGVVMNPVDHPHGGGEGRAPIGRKKPTTGLSCAWKKKNIENRICGIGKNVMGERRELNPRMVDSQSTALIHLATSAPSLI